jgi:hypothetical protein
LNNGLRQSEVAADIPLAELAEILAERIEGLELIGRGGMGTVYKGRQVGLGRMVAVKLLTAAGPDEGWLAERLTREARTLARLDHPHIVRIHEFVHNGDLQYFIMDYVEGENLRSRQIRQPLSPAQWVDLMIQICDGLAHAHERGIVHRDIKPENILVDGRDRVKLADFGLAATKTEEENQTRLTQAGHQMGTPHYMSPEQIANPRNVDQRSDLYSLGVVFYEGITAQLPVGRFAPPSRLGKVDGRFDDVVMRLLENRPDGRFQSAAELKSALAALLAAPSPARQGGKSLRRQRSELEQRILERPGDPEALRELRDFFIGAGEVAAVDKVSYALSTAYRRRSQLGPAILELRGLQTRLAISGEGATPMLAKVRHDLHALMTMVEGQIGLFRVQPMQYRQGEALKLTLTELGLFEQRDDVSRLLAGAYRQKNMRREAVDEYQEILRRHPQDASARTALEELMTSTTVESHDNPKAQ